MEPEQPSDPWYHNFNDVYGHFSAVLRRAAMRLLGRRLRRRVSDEDIVQSVFRTFHRRSSKNECKFDHTCALRNYLFKVLMNKVRKHAQIHNAQKRRTRRETEMDRSNQAALFLDPRPGPEEWAVVRDEVRFLTQGFLPRDMEILRLRLEGYAPSMIADEVGCSRWTVRRVMQGFGARLDDHLGEVG